ncbi:unnamed protein product [Arctia plantaginis]|uniref:DDE-1 domain-containing protein n=1 Tax=Arctia plantaginis TaxID=874455 RepID=A0A8S1B343_ARCPL|nr:unnamed protein product [Arctia plantaginis]
MVANESSVPYEPVQVATIRDVASPCNKRVWTSSPRRVEYASHRPFATINGRACRIFVFRLVKTTKKTMGRNTLGRERRKKGAIPPEAMQKGIELHLNTGLSIRKSAEASKIPYPTLRRYLLKYVKDPSTRLEPHYNASKIFTDQQEDSIKEYILDCANKFYGLTSKDSRRIAYQMAAINKIDMPPSWQTHEMAGRDWMRGFRTRHPELSIKKPEACSMARATAFNKHNVQNFFDNLKEVYNRTPSFANGSRVYNLDETSTTTVQRPQKVLAVKGSNVCKVTSGERGILFTSASKDNPALLILDNHESHLSIEALDIAKASGVTVLTLHPHTTARMQPLDVGLNGPFKSYYNAAIDSWLLCNPGKTLSIYNVAECVGIAYMRAMTPPPWKAEPRKNRFKRKAGKSMIATDTPEKNALAENKNPKQNKTRKRANVVKVTLFESIRYDSSSGGENFLDQSEEEKVLLCDNFPPLLRKPRVEDYVIIAFTTKKSKVYYIAQILEELEGEECDYYVSYFKLKNKITQTFSLPLKPDTAGVNRKDITYILPPPITQVKKNNIELSPFPIPSRNTSTSPLKYAQSSPIKRKLFTDNPADSASLTSVNSQYSVISTDYEPERSSSDSSWLIEDELDSDIQFKNLMRSGTLIAIEKEPKMFLGLPKKNLLLNKTIK